MLKVRFCRCTPDILVNQLMRWHKPARFAVAIFGIACAIAVYAAIGERVIGIPPSPPARLDPKAILESEGAQVQQERGAERDFDVTFDRQLTYEDGSIKGFGVRISVHGRQGRDFVLTGREAQAAGKEQQELQLSGAVKLVASDGFVLTTESASFSRGDGLVRAPGSVAFEKGRMSGSGVGMSYEQEKDVVSLLDEAQVRTVDERGTTQMQFTAGSAVLNRQQDVLTLEGRVHALRGEQVFDADHAAARLTPDEDAIVFIELRGNSRVTGGSGTFDAMSARDIDLDYTDDGETLEHVRLDGGAAIAMTGQNGGRGRQMMGESLELQVASDGAVTRASGREKVRLDLPASDGVAARSVTARSLDADGEPGRGLTAARFAENVEYREEGQRGAPARVARANGLRATLNEDTIDSAVFTGSVRFEDQGLQASGAEARYEPGVGRLGITGTDAGGPPTVADEQITIEAQKSIDVMLEGRSMTAVGAVRTSLRPGAARSARGRGDAAASGRLPGLFKGNEAANVNADTLQYEGGGGKAVYQGAARLWQGQTAIRADAITVDQENGDLIALGAASSNLVFENGMSIGRAAEIRYDEAKRTISYLSNIPPGPAGGGRGATATPPAAVAANGPRAAQALVSGPQGDLRADRIEVVLAPKESRAERLEAYTNVSARVDTRVATGGRLTYYAEDERYVLVGASPVPVRVVDRCRETSGKTLTFFKTADRIIVDGNEEIRTQTKSGGPCSALPPR
jgi:lipopolysaccharide export system protein LptA